VAFGSHADAVETPRREIVVADPVLPRTHVGRRYSSTR
jgi:hypothetical protein